MTTTKARSEPEYDTCSEFADVFRVSANTVRRAIARGDIYAVKIGGSVRIHRSERDRVRARSVVVGFAPASEST
jgi:excisionase family DNA binding protein